MAVIDVRASWLPPFIWFDTRFRTHVTAGGCREKWCGCDTVSSTMSDAQGYVTFNDFDVHSLAIAFGGFRMVVEVEVHRDPIDFIMLTEDLWASRADVLEESEFPCVAREQASARGPPGCVSLTTG